MVQNKELPGAYINFVSAASANAALSERGIATMPLELDWGPDGEVFEVTSGDFQKNSLKVFGYLNFTKSLARSSAAPATVCSSTITVPSSVFKQPEDFRL